MAPPRTIRMLLLVTSGGYIVNKILKVTTCQECVDALVDSPDNMFAMHLSLVLVKNNGGLYFPTMDVLKILRISEIVFKVFVSGSDFRAPTISSKKNMKNRMINQVMRELLEKYIFHPLLLHDLEHDSGTEDIRSTQLCRTIADRYFDI